MKLYLFYKQFGLRFALSNVVNLKSKKCNIFALYLTMEKTLMKSIKLLIVSLILTCSVPSFAGKVIKSAAKGYWEDNKVNMYVDGNKVRIDDPYMSIIFDFDLDEYYLLINESEVYIHGRIEDIKKDREMHDSISRATLTKEMDEEEKEKFLEIMENAIVEMNKPYLGEIDYKKTNELEEITGFKCRKYIVIEDGVEIEDVWIAEGEKLVDMVKIKTFFKEYGAPVNYQNSDKYLELIDKGLVIKSFHYTSSVTYKIYEVEDVEFEETKFLPSQDIKEITWFELHKYLKPIF